MLRTNLSTRPFYNERAVHVGIFIAALLVLAVTVLNVVRLVSLSRHSTELSARTNQERAEAARLTKEAADIRRTINRQELEVVVAAAREANLLIDQRTFSWTEFFNLIEQTMPPDVMLTSVRPSFEDGETRVAMIVLARRAEDVDEFMEKLEATGAFDAVLPTQQDKTEEGLSRVVVESVYRPQSERGAAEATGRASITTPPQPQGGRQ